MKLRLYRRLGMFSIFILSLLLVGPFLHEMMHVIWLEYESCFYSLDLNLGLTGLYGAVEPGCHLPDTSLIAFYSVGFSSTLLAGASLNFLAVQLQERTSRYIYPLSAGTGLMLSVVIGLLSKGDFTEVFKILGFDILYAEVFTAALMVSIIVSNFKSIDIILHELEGEE